MTTVLRVIQGSARRAVRATPVRSLVFPAPLMSTIQELGAFLNRETTAAAALPIPPATVNGALAVR